MSQQLQPHKVTKPIQLLAAWLVGLFAVDSAFLTGARLISNPQWAAAALVVAAIVCVPLFLVCIFLLQTKFRPQMQEDSYYSKYLAIQQQTRKITSPEGQVAQLREMLASTQTALTGSLSALDSGLTEIRVQLAAVVNSRDDKAAAKEAVEASARILSEARHLLLPAEFTVSVNDLLPTYGELRMRWQASHIKVSDTFGSNSAIPKIPSYSVIWFGPEVSGDAMHEVCKSIIDTATWYVGTSYEEYAGFARTIYVGAYGYGGQPLAPLDPPLLQEMSEPGFSTSSLIEWISKHTVHLEADYPTDPP